MHILGKLSLFVAVIVLISTGHAMDKAIAGAAVGTTEEVDQSPLGRMAEYVSTNIIHRPESRQVATSNNNTIKALRRLKHLAGAFLEVQPDTRKSRARKKARLGL